MPFSVFETGNKVHGEAFDTLAASLDETVSCKRLGALRERYHDPDLRFFLAALYLAADRDQLCDLIRAYHPGGEPRALIGDWLVQLLLDADEATEIPSYMSDGLGRLALGQPFERVREELADQGGGSAEFEEHLEFMRSAHKAIADASQNTGA